MLKAILVLHVAAGTTALVSMWIPMVARKGASLHRTVGKAYLAFGAFGLVVGLVVTLVVGVVGLLALLAVFALPLLPLLCVAGLVWLGVKGTAALASA